MTLAVVEGGRPLNCVVFYVTIDGRNLYFKSRTNSTHSTVLAHSPTCAAAVYDPTSTYDAKKGVQIIGKVEIVVDPSDLRLAVGAYQHAFEGASEKMQSLEELASGTGTSAIYRLTVEYVKFVDSASGVSFAEYQRFES